MIDSVMAILATDIMGATAGVWLAFLTLIVVVLALDLGVLNRKDHEIGVKESLWYSLGSIVLACIFGGWVWMDRGPDAGMDYYTAYFVEKSLSLDNLFVMSVIFAYFAVPRIYQHRVLFWGIIGVIVLRGILIGLGTAIIHRFEWVLLIFAAFLIFTGIKMVFSKDDDGPGIENSRLLKFLQTHLNVTKEFHGHAFWAREKVGDTTRLVATPLFLSLLCVEFADVLFAVDSVPAVLAITSDTFVVYTSNIFAVLGLRTLYFAVAAVIHRFEYMKYALSLILVFIGLKAFYAHFTGDKIPAIISLGLTLGTLFIGFVYSMYKTRSDAEALARQALAAKKEERP